MHHVAIITVVGIFHWGCCHHHQRVTKCKIFLQFVFRGIKSQRNVSWSKQSMKSQSSQKYVVPLSFAVSPKQEIVVPSLHFLEAQFYYYQKLNCISKAVLDFCHGPQSKPSKMLSISLSCYKFQCWLCFPCQHRTGLRPHNSARRLSSSYCISATVGHCLSMLPLKWLPQRETLAENYFQIIFTR